MTGTYYLLNLLYSYIASKCLQTPNTRRIYQNSQVLLARLYFPYSLYGSRNISHLTPPQISSLEAQLAKLQYELTDLDTTRTDQVNRQEGVLARCQSELAALNNKYNIALREVRVLLLVGGVCRNSLIVRFYRFISCLIFRMIGKVYQRTSPVCSQLISH